jgi:hypothetical protein
MCHPPIGRLIVRRYVASEHLVAEFATGASEMKVYVDLLQFQQGKLNHASYLIQCVKKRYYWNSDSDCFFVHYSHRARVRLPWSVRLMNLNGLAPSSQSPCLLHRWKIEYTAPCDGGLAGLTIIAQSIGVSGEPPAANSL